MIDFIAVDIECTLNGNEDVGLAHPMHPDNRAVLFGAAVEHATVVEDNLASFMIAIKDYLFGSHTLCGCNFSFDLLYLYKDPETKHHLQKLKIWDIQLAEYILTGQRTKFASLDELCIKYGLPVKDSSIKAYFAAGIGSDKIPRSELEPYLKGDVNSTLHIARVQYQEAVKANQLALIESQMEALHATTEMQFNGLCIDKPTLDSYTVEVVNEYVDIKLNLEEVISGRVDDINSPKQWSQLFFGGKKKIQVKEEVGVYKNGKTKFKLMDKVLVIKPILDYVPDPDKISDKTGQVSVDESVLTDMLKHTTNKDVISIIKALLRYRDLSKQLSTYVQGLSKHLIYQPVVDQYVIHGKLNHTATVTGRLSSTNPNLQNISNNPIKKIFTSRYGLGEGFLVEVDFNQLEVAALAHVTKDPQLIKDISTGTDIHSALYKSLYGRNPSKEERKPFKARTFQLIYGAGAKAISKQAGCTVDEAKKFISVFYRRYPLVEVWHIAFSLKADLEGKYLFDSDGLREKTRTFIHQTETGRKFMFKEYHSDASWSSREYSYSPTELKNYLIQGLATGDIVPCMLGIIFRWLVGRDDVKMINTIHDSILFDVRKDAAVDFIMEVQDKLKDTHKHFQETFKVPLALKLNAGATYGTNWFNMEEV